MSLPITYLNDVQHPAVLVDHEARVEFMNACALSSWRLHPDAALGQRMEAVLGGRLSPDALARLRGALKTGSAVSFEESGLGAAWPLRVAAYPTGTGMLVTLAQSPLAQAEAHRRALATISLRLASALTLSAAARVLVDELPRTLGGSFAAVVLLEPGGEQLRTVAFHGLPAQTMTGWDAFPLAAPVPLAAAVRSGQSIFVTSREAAAASYPLLLSAENDNCAWASLPLTLEGETFGALGLSFTQERPFDGAEQDFLHAVATIGAQALDRARLLDAERRARERLTFFAQASEALAGSLDLDTTLASVTRLAVPRVADWCAVYLPEGEHLRLLAATHVHGDKLAALRGALDAVAVHQSDPGGAGRVLRTGEPVFVPDVTPAASGALGYSPEQTAQLRALGLRSYMSLPMVARGRTVGVVAFARSDTLRPYSSEDLELAQELARRAGVALDHARLYQEAQAWTTVLERTVGKRTEELAERTEELDARNRALDAFGTLSRDLATETDRVALLRRAQEILLTLLPDGLCGYFEPEEQIWRLRALSGPAPDGGLLAPLLRGLPRGTTPTFDEAFETGNAVYVERFQPNLAEAGRAPLGLVRSMAVLPVGSGASPTGVLVFALFVPHGWSRAERALLDTARHKIRLALQRAEAVRALAERTAELEVVNEELNAFTTTVSHDLRTPVRHILSFSALLRRTLGDAAPPRALTYLGTIEASATHMTQLTDALLTFARTARQPLRRSRVDLNVLVHDAIRDLHLDLTGEAVTWRLSPLPEVQADPTLLRQVLVNLLSNAVKYSAGRSDPTVSVTAQEEGEEVTVTVADNGVGFDPAHVDRLFGVFSRLHRADEFEGVGIGLATVKRIVTRHGGRAWAQGVPGEGATFSFALPAAPRSVSGE
ncbi:GAF domain-containing protein (plasmid) [Deinococcus taeanensis]|uniref:GAF domain-containing protein n=1 Tax=Deinococcus taeanensis TaxID=2737050 RepID=UPI001CDCDF16|nr:GAF domain-containing protein [Deinococcus taeanensis]UBV45402.1 GAF domain-containing protein [Deinococcus taeanensis]